ncbi:hypothetical protein [Sphingomonas hengshuiensis]|uniref:Uncharacterized protein n=1 Tax=Sphingomonas hengshuiensis TaxID=1609977 RepID=A0A7U4J9V1_9SPHN|nr:hypothetical protein [Sphingomonas hengshuiensis]AJP72925.1 hypothetical protein TS85_15695 [Sphingomonas hengshuiensis]
MTMITMPAAPIPAKVEWNLPQPTQVNRSEITSRRRVTILSKAPRWTASVELPEIRGEANVRPWRAFFGKLNGRANSFRLIAVENDQHAIAQSVVVDGSGQQGFSLATRGWYPRLRLGEGCLVTVADQLLELTEPAIADATGRAVLNFVAYLRVPSIDGAAIETRRPFGVMSLATDDGKWIAGKNQRYSISFACEESF